MNAIANMANWGVRIASRTVKVCTDMPSRGTGGIHPSGRNPSGGLWMKNDPMKQTATKSNPKTPNEDSTPRDAISVSATG
jgi:hypothetical protein